MEKKNTKAQVILRLLLSVLGLSLLLLAVYLILHHFGITELTTEQIRAYIADRGVFAFWVFVLLSFLQVTFIPIPSTVTVLAGNLLFGPWLSFLGSLLGTWLGSSLAFLLGRVIGRPFVNWVVGDGKTVDKYLEKARGREFVVFFFMFLLPAFPDDALCAVAGVTKLRWPQFLFIQAVCRPIGIAGTLFFMTGEVIPYHGWGILLLLGLAALSILAFLFTYRRADRLQTFFDKLFPPRKP